MVYYLLIVFLKNIGLANNCINGITQISQCVLQKVHSNNQGPREQIKVRSIVGK